MSNDTTKTCSKCGNTYPATTEYFHQETANKDGLRNECKHCRYQYRQANKQKTAEYQRQYKIDNKDRLAKRDSQYYQDNKDRFREYRLMNQDKLREYFHEYYQTHKDENRESRIKYGREYRQSNSDKVSEYKRSYKKSNRNKLLIIKHRYRARKRELPDTFTLEQWLKCLTYFNYSCAVCRIEFGDTTPHADHWIPLNNPDCLGTVVTNIVCLCGTCNLSKNAKLPKTWLMGRYGVDRASEILRRIETYFEFVVR